MDQNLLKNWLEQGKITEEQFKSLSVDITESTKNKAANKFIVAITINVLNY